MTVSSQIQDALAVLMADNTDLAVTVQYRSQSATGLRVLVEKETEATMRGNQGEKLGTVRVNASEISEPVRGAHVKVGGLQVHVLSVRTSGGVRVIRYSDTKPIVGL